MTEYHGDFSSWDDVRENFEPSWDRSDSDLQWGGAIASRRRKVPPTEPEDVLWAEYDQPSDEGYATVIYRQGDRVFEVTGLHCSCYGLEGQWEPEEYDIPTYIAFADQTNDDWMSGKGRAVAAAKLKLLTNG